MTQQELDDLEQRAKKHINEVRKKHGKRALAKLKKGVPYSISACTVAMSVEGVHPLNEELWNNSDVENFAMHFDHGCYPKLEIPLSKIRKKEGRKMVEIG